MQMLSYFQAAIGAISLETAREHGYTGKPEEEYGKNVSQHHRITCAGVL